MWQSIIKAWGNKRVDPEKEVEGIEREHTVIKKWYQIVNDTILELYLIHYPIYLFGIKYNLTLVSKIIHRYQKKNLIPKDKYL